MKVMWHIVTWSQKISYKFGHCFRIVQEKTDTRRNRFWTKTL